MWFYPHITLVKDSSLRFASIPVDFVAHFKLAFATAPFFQLNLAAENN